MVPAEQTGQLANVVFVVEGTANLIPYVENLKTNYILPTLEYFNGGALDDYEYENVDNNTLYGLVIFMASDASPEPVTSCYPVTTSTKKFLSWFDKSTFMGGSAEAHSHVAEGLSTALQLFSDLADIRNPNISIQNHCILVCNSSYYSFPALETPAYSGLLPEQLVSIMVEQNINLSIISPRKIPMLYKLFELSGGDIQQAHNKNFAKDKRHLILLKGYHLQECPANPPNPTSIETKYNPAAECSNSQSPSPLGGQKRSNSPSLEIPFKKPCTNQVPPTSLGGPTLPNQQSFGNEISPPHAANAGLSYLPSQNNPSGLSIINQPNPPNVNAAGMKGAPQQTVFQESFQQESFQPMGHSWNQPTPSYTQNPATSSILCNQLSMPGNASIAQNMGTRPSVALAPSLNTSAVSQAPYMYNFQQTQAPSMPQRPFPQGIPQAKINPLPNMPNGTKPLPGNEQRATIWQGIVEVYEKSPSALGSMNANRLICTLPCTISCHVINGEPELTSDNWHKTLSMSLIPKQLFFLPPLSTHLKTSRQVEFHFNKDGEGFQTIFKILNSGFVGCIQYPQSDIRILIVLSVMEKRTFLGVIARDQEAFYNALRQVMENTRKNQMKQRMNSALNAGAVNIQPSNPLLQQINHQINPQPMNTAPPGQQQQHPRYQFFEERQKNLMKIQHLRQNLEAAQQREMQFKAHEQKTDPPYHQAGGIDQPPPATANPQLRHLLQQQVQQLQPQQPPQPILLTSIGSGMATSTYNPHPNSNLTHSSGGTWDDKSLMDLLPSNP